MYYTYILRSRKSGHLYTGHTQDLLRRLSEHNSGHNLATKNRGPFELVHSEEFLTKSGAYNREVYFKTGKGREELKKIMGR